MESERYCQNIRNRLSQLVTAVRIDGSVNLHSLNIHAEGFFVEFLNLLYGWNLKNANAEEQNAAGIDLIDRETHILVQVSSDHTHGKIQDSMDGAAKKGYRDYHYYFMAISETTQNYRAFRVPDGLTFDEKHDVLNIKRLTRDVMDAGINKQKALSELVEKYFGATEKKLSCLTRMPPNANTDNVICREKELAEITALIKEGKDILLMSGFGGIGKTALARLVFHSVKDCFDEVAWVPYNGNLKNSMLASIELGENLCDPEERWQRIRALKNDGRKKLFVIDNTDHNNNQDPQKDADLQSLSGWPNTTVIVTSRLNQLESYQVYPVGFLSKEEDCIELFYLYYENDPERAQEETVRALLKLAKNHTFTIELLAKSANCEDDLAQFHQDLVEKGFSFPEIEVDAAHNEATATIAEHLRILFDMRTRTPDQAELLWDFAVLPVDASLNKTEIKDWFGIDVNQCERLVGDGWLSRKEGRYAMHPLVRQIILLDDIPDDTAAHYLDFMEDYHNGYFPKDMVYTEIIRRLKLAETVVGAVCRDGNTVRLAHILHNLGGACWQVAQYDDAVSYYERALVIKEAKLGPNHLDTAETYNDIAITYWAMGINHKALEHIEKALIIRETTLGKEHPDTAVAYNDMAGVYLAMGDNTKALEFFQKGLTIRETKLGIDHPETAGSYNNIALSFYRNGDFQKALEYHEKALAIVESKLGTEHPYTATTYNNLGLIYNEMGNYSKALECHKRALTIDEIKYGKDNPKTAISNTNLGSLFYKMEQYPCADCHFLRALRVFLRKLGSLHLYTRATFVWLANSYQAQHGETDSFLPWLRGQLNEEENRALDEMLGANAK